MTIRVKVSKKELERFFAYRETYHLPDFIELEGEPVSAREAWDYNPRQALPTGEEKRVEHRDLKHCPNCVFPPNWNCDCSCHTPKREEHEHFYNANAEGHPYCACGKYAYGVAPKPTECCKGCKVNPEWRDCHNSNCPCHKRETLEKAT